MTQFINNHLNFAFLASPPPPRSSPNPSPPPISNNAYYNIVAWASLVQPGSPAPRSPQRRPSISSSRPSSSFSRRPSISHAPAKTPSVRNFDLTALGYTSVFVHLPKTPTTPSPYLPQRSKTTTTTLEMPPAYSAYPPIPVPPIPSEEPPVKRTGFSRLRSLSILRPRSSKSKQQPPPSPTSVVTAPKQIPTKSKKHPTPTPPDSGSSTIAKRKRAKYPIPTPPSLANELAIMQFLEGGNMESNAKRAMEAQAKQVAGSGPYLGVGDVHRDANGRIWWDTDEEWEYTHLLADSAHLTPSPGKTDDDPMAVDWEHFQVPSSPCYFPSNFIANKENNDPFTSERRDSLSSQDSDLDPKYLVTAPEHALSGFNAPVEDRVLASHKIGGPGMSILSLPCRPRRKATHLNKPDFVLDLAAFGPRSPTKSTTTTTTTTTTPKPKPKGQARRRPAPLKLAHQNQNAVVVVRRPQVKTPATAPTSTVLDNVENVRKEFIADSFAPIPVVAATTTTNKSARTTSSRPVVPPPPQQNMNRKPSRPNMRGIFGRKAN